MKLIAVDTVQIDLSVTDIVSLAAIRPPVQLYKLLMTIVATPCVQNQFQYTVHE
jgi:hypothetical protein